MPANIVVAGSSNTDMILQVDHIPRPGETILGGRFSMAAGGKGANQAVSAARAGGQVAFLGRVGNDLFGQQALAGLDRDGIDVQGVLRDPAEPSGVALIFVAESGENAIGVASGANGALSPRDIEAAARRIAAAEVLVMQLEIPLETVVRAAEIAAQHAVRVILDPAPAQPLSRELLRNVDWLTPNEHEAEQLTGIAVTDAASAARAAEALRKEGAGGVIVTLGAGGALVSSNELTGAVPGHPVEAVDTTAAGDCFNGALAVALAEGAPIDRAVRFANAAAALSVTRLGAQPSVPTRPEIDQRLAEGD